MQVLPISFNNIKKRVTIKIIYNESSIVNLFIKGVTKKSLPALTN